MPDTANAAHRLYGRRKGKPLRAGRQALIDEDLPKLRVTPAAAGAATLNPAGLFPFTVREVWLEIGFGGGEHLADQAAQHPDIGFIGAEVYLNGTASLLRYLRERSLSNVRILDADVRPFLETLAEGSLNRVFLLFPDPWPKARHAKRRFISTSMLDELARVMADDADFRIATDHPVYANWVLRHVPVHAAFRWQVTGPADWRQRPADGLPTRYEEKALKDGRQPVYLTFRRTVRGD